MAQQSLDLIEAMYAKAEAAHPITGRGVGYKLFTPGLIPSMATSEMAKVYRLLRIARYTKNYVHDTQHGINTVSIPPRDGGMWCTFDKRSDERTGWRRISLECGGVS